MLVDNENGKQIKVSSSIVELSKLQKPSLF